MAAFLIDCGANVDKASKYSETPIFIAASVSIDLIVSKKL